MSEISHCIYCGAEIEKGQAVCKKCYEEDIAYYIRHKWELMAPNEKFNPPRKRKTV